MIAANSAIAEASRTDFDWNAILEGASWFHFTGITPALGELLPEICLEALKTAREKGIPVSCDLNYRGKLWDKEKACKVMSGLMPYVDVCIANEADAADVFGIHAEDTVVGKRRIESSWIHWRGKGNMSPFWLQKSGDYAAWKHLCQRKYLVGHVVRRKERRGRICSELFDSIGGSCWRRRFFCRCDDLCS